MMALCMILYGIFRIIVEFFREPDAHLGFIAAGITMGQLLSSLMITAGVILFLVRKKQQHVTAVSGQAEKLLGYIAACQLFILPADQTAPLSFSLRHTIT